MKLSVALCTYNGEKFIERQLESIANQTVPVTQVIICDDNSTDRTIAIIEKFIIKQSLNIDLQVNKSNLGVIKNFEKAIHLCDGDVIFFSDQDDIWLPEKVETIVNFLAANPDCFAVFSDAYLIDDADAVVGTSLWDVLGFKEVADRARELPVNMMAYLLYKRNVVTGACLAVTKGALKIILPFITEVLHDEWIAFKLASVNKILLLNKPLIKYRIHEGQFSKIRDYVNADKKNEMLPEVKNDPVELDEPLNCYRHWKRRMKVMEMLELHDVEINTGLKEHMTKERKAAFLKIIANNHFPKRKLSLIKLWMKQQENIKLIDVLTA